MTVGVLCEKADARERFERAFGGRTGVFNGEDYVLVNASGHLYGLLDPHMQVGKDKVEQYKKWTFAGLPWNENDFAWKYGYVSPAARGHADRIKSELSKCSEIVIATDVDPSGEGGSIAVNILREVGLTSGKKFSRMYFTDDAPASLQKGFKARKPISSPLELDEYLQSNYRSKWDWLSQQFTRAASMAVGQYGTVLRQGRLKSPIVVLVGDGQKAIKAYKKIPSYMNKFKDENGVIYTSVDEPSFPNRDQVPQSYHASDVVFDGSEIKRTPPPKLLDLAGLVALLSSEGIDTGDVTDTYQKMYQHKGPINGNGSGEAPTGVVSYPRTEDKHVTTEQFNELLPFIDQIARVVGADPGKLTVRTPRRSHVKDSGAHGANRPGLNVPKSIADIEAQFGRTGRRIYEVLAKNYLSMLGEDYTYESQKGHIKEYPSFIGSASVPKSLGYRAIFDADAELADDGDKDDDTNAKGLGSRGEPYIHEGFPPRPPSTTIKWLVRQLEKRNVGTGATQSSTITEVLKTGKGKTPLLKLDKKGVLSLSEPGQMSYAILQGTHIGDMALTEKVLAEAKKAAVKEFDVAAGLHEMQQLVKDDIDVMKRNAVQIRKDFNVSDQQAEYVECEFEGEPRRFKKVWRGHEFNDEEVAKLISGGTVEVHGLKSAAGNEYAVEGKLAMQEFKGHKFLGFMQTGFAGGGSGGGGGLPKSWSGHTFTDDERAKLEAGEEILIKGYTSKAKGTQFDAKTSYKQKEGETRKSIVFNFN